MSDYRVYLPKTDPPATLTSVCMSVNVPVELIPYINAHLFWLTRSWMWGNDNEAQQELVIDAITALMGQLAEQCAMLEDIRITPNGLEKKNCDGDWVVVGSFPIQPVLYFEENRLKIDTNGDGIPDEISPTLNLYQTYADPRLTLPEWPTANELDVYCYAAWKMATYYQDRATDFAQLLDVSAATIGSLVENFVSLMFGVILPGVGEDIVSPIAEFVNDGLVQAPIDFFRQNVAEMGARAAAAEIFYCAIKETITNGQHPENIQANIEKRIPSALLFAASKAVGGNWLINGISGALSFVLGQSDDKAVGAFIVGYSLVLNSIIADEFELSKTYQSIFAFAAREAQFFDGRDCAEFTACADEWEHLFDFTQSQHGWNPSLGTYTAGVGFTHTLESPNSPYRAQAGCALSPLPAGDYAITSIEVTYSVSHGGGSARRSLFFTIQGVNDTEFSGTDSTISAGDGVTMTRTGTVNRSQLSSSDYLVFQVKSNAVTQTPSAKVTAIRLRGTGVNPFV